MNKLRVIYISGIISTIMLIVSLFYIDFSEPKAFQLLNAFTFLTITIMNILLIRDLKSKNKPIK